MYVLFTKLQPLDPDSLTFTAICATLNAYYKRRYHVLAARAEFYQCRKEPEQTYRQWAAELQAADRRLESWADVAAIRDDATMDAEDVAAIQVSTPRSYHHRGRRPPPQQDAQSHHPGRSQKSLQQPQHNRQRRRHRSPPPAPPTQQPQPTDQLPGPSLPPPHQPMATDEVEPMPLVPPMPTSQPVRRSARIAGQVASQTQEKLEYSADLHRLYKASAVAVQPVPRRHRTSSDGPHRRS
ncbi:cell division protein ZipA-like [Schistocerca piceifrons]|uniref:cell division protein ZipA-like n=1 Tax=Schistocerca piceifrons TaxID=274613 RepID=UPI001F5F9F32|nr:cell division protein ZipA-like [Schistocerca piceifrons]